MTSYLMNSFLLAQFDNNGGGGGDAAGAAAGGLMGLCCMGLYFLPIIAAIAGMWKVFEKAGKPGWAAIVPIYNLIVLTEISGRDMLWFVLALVPCVQIVALILINIDVAKNFGKDAGWGLGLAFLPFIFYPLLGFGAARYQPQPKM